MKLVALFLFSLSAICFGQTKHRIVVEVCSAGKMSYTSALNNVENLQRAFLGEPLEVEIVCHGDGIDLVFSHDNTLASRVKKLSGSGVKFAACGNTLRNRNIGKDRILPFVSVVDSGTAEVIRKQEAGWSYLKR